MIAVREANPALDIRMVFAADNKLHKHSPTRYSDWCVKNGFKYHIGIDVPREWLDSE